MEPADSILGPQHPVERRTFMAMIAGGFLAAPLAAEAQQAGKVWRIGYLSPGLSPPNWTSHGPGPTAAPGNGPFVQGMKDLGYVEGRDFVMEYRWAEGHLDRLPDLAADLVRAHVDVIVTSGTTATRALKQATQTSPIVFAFLSNAVEKGIVASLARPGGNVTGTSTQVQSKFVQLLKDAVPTVSRVVYLRDPAVATPGADGLMQSWAQAVKVELQIVALRESGGVTQAFAEFNPGTNGLLLDNSIPNFLAADQICGLALRRRLPTVAVQERRFPAAGCLMSYGENSLSAFRNAAVFVDKILKGAKPADLPVEQPTTFELVINLKTAKALGLTIPPSLLARADQVIE